MKTLLRKELRAQLPFLLLIAFLFLLNASEHLIGHFPDEQSLAGMLNEHNEGGHREWSHVPRACDGARAHPAASRAR
jgi:hypothetical protein